jgi:hypothetical protein
VRGGAGGVGKMGPPVCDDNLKTYGAGEEVKTGWNNLFLRRMEHSKVKTRMMFEADQESISHRTCEIQPFNREAEKLTKIMKPRCHIKHSTVTSS